MDNARPHTGSQMSQWLDEERLLTVGFSGSPKNFPGSFPPSSPDLNPIELMWSIVDAKVSKRKYSNMVEFKRVIIEEWNAVNMKTVRNCINHLKKTFRKVIENEGASTVS